VSEKPLKRFPDKLRLKFEIVFSSEGINPSNKFPDKSKNLRCFNSNKFEGREPVKLFEERFNPTTTFSEEEENEENFSHKTPNQEQWCEKASNQFEEFDQEL